MKNVRLYLLGLGSMFLLTQYMQKLQPYFGPYSNSKLKNFTRSSWKEMLKPISML